MLNQKEIKSISSCLNCIYIQTHILSTLDSNSPATHYSKERINLLVESAMAILNLYKEEPRPYRAELEDGNMDSGIYNYE